MGIRVGAHLSGGGKDEDYPKFLKQYGVVDVLAGYPLNPVFSGAANPEMVRSSIPFWTTQELIQLRESSRSVGLRLIGMENAVPPWCFDRIILGLPGRDEQIENYLAVIRSMGEAGLQVLGYNWKANAPGVKRNSFRTDLDIPGRGDAQIDAFELDKISDLPLFREREFLEGEIWESYKYFIQAVVPTAEKAGVRLALHPDDPPIDRIGGVARIFHDFQGFQRAMDFAESPASGLNFCLGNWTAMGADVPAAVLHFGGKDQIVMGHVQGVQGTATSFRECFIDEADCDFPAVFRALNKVGFDGVMIPGHYPRTVNDTPRQLQAQAFTLGYVKALIQACETA